MFKALKHLSKGRKLLSKGFEHMFQALEHKMHRGRNYFLLGAEEKSIGFKKIFVYRRLRQNMWFFLRN